KPGESVPERVVVEVDDRLEKGQWHVLARDRRGLEQALVLGRKSVDARGENRLDAGGHRNRLGAFHQPVRTARAGEQAGLDERADTLFEEQRVALRSLNQARFERLDARVRTEQLTEEVLRALGREWVDAELSIVGLVAPAVLVLGPVVDSEQDGRRRHALHQAVEERLRLGV